MNDHSKYLQWKKSIPLVYDFFTHHNLQVPSPCVHWSSVLSKEEKHLSQIMCFSERGNTKNHIIISKVKVPSEYQSDLSRISQFNESKPSPHMETLGKIKAPRNTEVNRLRTFPTCKHLLLSKSDLSDLHIWDISDPSSPKDKDPVVLKGHEDGVCESSFAVDTCDSAMMVASGDQQGNVLIWDVQSLESGTDGKKALSPIQSLKGDNGHTDTVEAVKFQPKSSQELCSAGDDKSIRLWDLRAPEAPVASAFNENDNDFHCVDWSAFDLNSLLAGDSQGVVYLYDKRKFSAESKDCYIRSFSGHTAAVTCLEFNPLTPNYFASGGEDGCVVLWDTNKEQAMAVNGSTVDTNVELIFNHVGHRGSIQDLNWNPESPWCLATVSEDSSEGLGGGTIQIWRSSSLSRMTKDELSKEIELVCRDSKRVKTGPGP
uniref:Histone-binding protein RBBP4-like N-terminal domain-containing protein n=1 Tax=Guillardia theta TaxID=55529 RepID=A0A7S4HBU8_GUITH|mmetsp:Transcript_13334/g.46553  ORF Transcript_13334/g.46553 Transcript_13334/m.46553 type:complete len:430 (+) Transcript_13334:250-1539(+)